MSVRPGLALVVGLLVVGCSGASRSIAPTVPSAAPPSMAAVSSPTVVPTTTPSATAAPTSKPTPAPTPRPLTREQAGPKFEAAIFSYRDQLAQIGAKDGTTLRCVYSTPPSCKQSQLAALKSHWLAMTASLDGYGTALAEIGFPKVAARAAATFIDALGEAKQAAEAAAGATTIQQHNELAATAQDAIAALDQPEYKLMEALDWIVGP